MASKAYVASLTLSELKRELKQRGLSARGSKKDLRDRLEQALDEEELDDPSSESDTEGAAPLQGTGFNFEVLPESFIKEETPEEEAEPMIVSVELSSKENLEVYPHRQLADEGWGQINENKGPMIVAIELKSAKVHEEQGSPSPLTEGREVAGNSQAMAQQVETAVKQDEVGEAGSRQRSPREEAAVKIKDGQGDHIQQAAVSQVEMPVAVEDSAPPQPVSSPDVAAQAAKACEQPVGDIAETHEQPMKVELSLMHDQLATPDVKGGESLTPDELTPLDVKVEEPCVPDQITVPGVSAQEPSAELEQTSQIKTPPESCPMEEQRYEEQPTQCTEEDRLQQPTPHIEEEVHEEVMMEERIPEVSPPSENMPKNSPQSVESATEGDTRGESQHGQQKEVEPSEGRKEDETTGDRELDQPVGLLVDGEQKMELDQPEDIANKLEEMVEEVEQQVGAEVLLPPAVADKSGERSQPCDEGSVDVGGRAEGEGVWAVQPEGSRLEQPTELGEQYTQAEEPVESDRETMEAKQTECEHPVTEQQDKADSSGVLPPAGEESGVLPPAGEESGVLPPAGEESGVLPPAGEESGVLPPAGEESGVLPPAGEESGVLPPAGEESGVLPPAGEESGMLPPAGEESGVLPPAGEESGVLPPAGEESGVLPSAGEESGVLPPAGEEITERVSASDSNFMGEGEGTEHGMDTGPGAKPNGEADMEVDAPEEEEERNGMGGEEEGSNTYMQDCESVDDKRAQKQEEEEEGEENQGGERNRCSQGDGGDPNPDPSANPKEQETEHVEEVEAVGQDDPEEESTTASDERAAGGDANREGQGVDEAKLDSGSNLEQGSADATPPQKEGEVSQLGLESGQIDVDVLVHAEEDDLSVFSTEAAEAQALTTTRDRDKKAKHSSSSRRSNGYSRKREQVASSRSGTAPSQTRKSPPDNPKRQREHKSEPQCEQPSIKRRRISAQGSSSVDNGSNVSGHQERRRRWGSAKQRSGSTSATTISSDVLKDIIPAGLEEEGGVEGGGVTAAASALDSVMVYGGGEEEEEGEVVSEKGTGEEETEGKGDQLLDAEHQREWEEVEKEREVKRRAMERARQEVETRKRIEARLKAKQKVEAKLKMEEKVKRRTPSPARNPPSRILHVEHLTRPFTTMELKELLTQDGPIVSESFWTNKIKSHCIVLYKSQESAVATRTRIHGIKWPSTNPKLLYVEYLTPSDVERITEGEMVVRKEEEPVEEENEEKQEDEKVVRESGEEEGMEVEEEGGREGEEVPGHATSTRIRQASPSPAPPSPKGVEKRAVEREVSPPPAKKETDKTTKLLDELFRKTKTTPSIYWLPLNDAQVKERQDLMRAREAERERQRQERARLRQEQREREDKERREREERDRRERERRIREERERRAKERMRRRSRSRSRSRSRDRRRR